jgi:hypothetical protein
MMKAIFAVLAATSVLALTQPAIATVVLPGTPAVQGVPAPFFTVSGNPFTGTSPVTANIGDTIALGTITTPYFFTDDFQFTIGPKPGGNFIGTGSGQVSTITGTFQSDTDLDFSTVTVNGVPVIPVSLLGGLYEFAFDSNVPIYSGVLNDIIVTGYSRGLGSYGGTITFQPGAVPEPATWAMMLLGFGFMGMGLRGRRRRGAALETA